MTVGRIFKRPQFLERKTHCERGAERDDGGKDIPQSEYVGENEDRGEVYGRRESARDDESRKTHVRRVPLVQGCVVAQKGTHTVIRRLCSRGSVPRKLESMQAGIGPAIFFRARC